MQLFDGLFTTVSRRVQVMRSVVIAGSRSENGLGMKRRRHAPKPRMWGVVKSRSFADRPELKETFGALCAEVDRP